MTGLLCLIFAFGMTCAPLEDTSGYDAAIDSVLTQSIGAPDMNDWTPIAIVITKGAWVILYRVGDVYAAQVRRDDVHALMYVSYESFYSLLRGE